MGVVSPVEKVPRPAEYLRACHPPQGVQNTRPPRSTAVDERPPHKETQTYGCCVSALTRFVRPPLQGPLVDDRRARAIKTLSCTPPIPRQRPAPDGGGGKKGGGKKEGGSGPPRTPPRTGRLSDQSTNANARVPVLLRPHVKPGQKKPSWRFPANPLG